jgi:hypothetical protein
MASGLNLVHGVLLQTRLDAAVREIEQAVALQGRILGATPRRWRRRWSGGAGAGLGVMTRARRRALPAECPVLVGMDDGTLAEGVADLAFEEQVGGRPCWTVVDFKTDVEIGGHLAKYRAQLEIYMRGIARSTGAETRGILLLV